MVETLMYFITLQKHSIRILYIVSVYDDSIIKCIESCWIIAAGDRVKK
jgi:hypothetical protein